MLCRGATLLPRLVVAQQDAESAPAAGRLVPKLGLATENTHAAPAPLDAPRMVLRSQFAVLPMLRSVYTSAWNGSAQFLAGGNAPVFPRLERVTP